MEQSVEAGITTGSTITLTSWTPVAGEIVVIGLAQRNESIAPSVAGNGQTWTQIMDIDNVQGQNGIVMWANVISSPSTGSIEVTITGNTLPATAIAARFSFSGSTLAIGANASDDGPATDDDDMLVAITTTLADSLIVAFGTHRSSTFTVPAGQDTIDINNSYGSGGDVTTSSMWSDVATSVTSYTMGGLNDLGSVNDWVIGAIELKQAAPSTAVPNALMMMGVGV